MKRAVCGGGRGLRRGGIATALGLVLVIGAIPGCDCGDGQKGAPQDAGADAPPARVSLRILPENPRALLGTTLQLEARARQADGSESDVTGSVAWISSDESIASIAGGLVSANALGSVTLSAELEGLTATASLRVEKNGFESTPAHGEQGVAVGRPTILRLRYPLAAGSTLDTDDLHADFGGGAIPQRAQLSADRKTLTLFYPTYLPGSARVRVTLRGDRLLDEQGNALDADGDGQPGGTAHLDFDTLSITPVPGTAVAGRVFASELAQAESGTGTVSRPLAGVTISVDGTSITAMTDSMGNFRLEPVPAGRFFVHIDGKTAEGSNRQGAYYPLVGKAWSSRAGELVMIDDVYLPLIPEGTLQPVSDTADTTITLPPSVLAAHPELDGVTITVPAGSLYADTGARGGSVGIAPVPPDRLPSRLPPGLGFPLVITVQTDGPSNFDVPAPVCFPNQPDPMTGVTLAAGAKSALWSFNHHIGEWEVVGPMTVSADGRLACSYAGVGIRQPGWHGDDPGCSGRGDTNNAQACRQDSWLARTEGPAGDSGGCQSRADQKCGDGLPEGMSLSEGSNSQVKNLDRNLKKILKHIVQKYAEAQPSAGGGYPGSALPLYKPRISSGHEHDEHCLSRVEQCPAKAENLSCAMPGIIGCTEPDGSQDFQCVADCLALKKCYENGRKPLDCTYECRNRCSRGRANCRDKRCPHYNASEHYNYKAIDLSNWDTGGKGRRYMPRSGAEAIARAICGGCTLKPAKNPKWLHGHFGLGCVDGMPTTRYEVLLESPLANDDLASECEKTRGRNPPNIECNQHFHIQILPAARCEEPNCKCLTIDEWEPPAEACDSSQVRGPRKRALASSIPTLGGPYYVAIEMDGFLQRVRTSSSGTYSLSLPPNAFAWTHLFDPVSGLVKHGSAFTAPSGFATDLFHQEPREWEGYVDPVSECSEDSDSGDSCDEHAYAGQPIWLAPSNLDSDGDGLAEDAEFIVGTDALMADTDGDGIADLTEVQQGTDPLDGRPARTGVFGAIRLPGTAVDVCAAEGTAIVAGMDAGISVLNVFNGLEPTIVAQVDTPGQARAVACGAARVAVADGTAGLVIVDTTDPPAARVVHQVALGGSAQAVTSTAGVAYVGTDAGRLAAVDLESGRILDSLQVDGAVQDVTLGGDFLYVVTAAGLHAVSLGGEAFAVAGSVPLSPMRIVPLGRMRVFAGDGVAYVTHAVGYDTFDLVEPARPRLIAEGRTAQFGWRQIVANGSGIGVAVTGPARTDDQPHQVALYDLRDPARNDRFLAEFATAGGANAVAVYNGVAYVADANVGLEVVNYLASDTLRVPPTIQLRTNASGTSLLEGQLLRLTASVTDDVQVRSVDFFVDGRRVATRNGYPFEHRLTTPLARDQASLRVRATATDTGGNATPSEEIVLGIERDMAPPAVRRLAPSDHASTVETASVAVYLSESLDPASIVGGIVRVSAAGPDGTVHTGDDVPVPGGTVSYRAEQRAVLLTLASPLPLGRYAATLAPGLRDLAGNTLSSEKRWSFCVAAPAAPPCSDGICMPGADCRPTNPCHAGVFACGGPLGDTRECRDLGQAQPNGTDCGTNQVCADGVCIACTRGAECAPTNLCHRGAVSCDNGRVCTDTGTPVTPGTRCGPDSVCNPAGNCIPCREGADCPAINPCHLGGLSCGTGVPLCLDSGALTPAGTACPGGICSGGACVPCVAGRACAPVSRCHAGTVTCGANGVQCADSGTNAQDGTSCGAEQVCSNGSCVSCRQGAGCPVASNPCHAGTLDCARGPVCTDTGTNLANGTDCGTSPTRVCSAGSCVACRRDTSCTSSNPCHAATIACTSGAEVCTDSGNAPDGTSCPGGVCGGGTCIPCTLGSSCTPANPCHDGTISACAPTITCTDSGTNRTAGSSCGAGQVCTAAGACVACTPGAACDPGTVCHRGQQACTTGPVCNDTGSLADGTSCGTNLVCSTGQCVACTPGEACPVPGQPCQVGARSCTQGPTCTSVGQVPSGTLCRAAAGTCDVAETCPGGAAACPPDGLEPTSTVCRAAAGACDLAETCSGTSATCPADAFSPTTTVCRVSAGPCDVAETCSGAATVCPADALSPTSTVCRATAGPCDVAETCSGTSASCPADAFSPTSTVCRAAAGPCDVAENCSGTATACPADAFSSSSNVCRAVAGPCDLAENCPGTTAACPADAFSPTSTVCRAAAGPCDVAETCPGTASVCPTDGLAANGTSCDAQVRVCCTGTCTDRRTDKLNCATCGNVCYGGDSNAQCASGTCSQLVVSTPAPAISTWAGDWPIFNGRRMRIDGANIYFGVMLEGQVMQTSKAAVGNTNPLLLAVETDGGTAQMITGVAVDATHVYFTAYDGAIRKVPIGGGVVTTLQGPNPADPNFAYPFYAAIANGNVYFASGSSSGPARNRLSRIATTGGGSASVITTAVGQIGGLEADATNLYWTDQAGTLGTIGVWPLAGGPVGTLATGELEPLRMTLNATHVFWDRNIGSCGDAVTIRTVPKDGSLAASTVVSAAVAPGGLAADAGGAIYWNDTCTGAGSLGPVTRFSGGATAVVAGNAAAGAGSSLVIDGAEIFYFSEQRVSDVWYVQIWRSAR